jgi:hypothetical protein
MELGRVYGEWKRGWPRRHRRAEQRKKKGGSFVTNG